MASRWAGTPWLLSAVLGTLMLSLHVSPSLAQTPSTDAKAEAMAVYKTAAAQFDKGIYDKALKGYAAAYKLFPHADFLYMVARCHEMARDYRKALELYREVRTHQGVSGNTRGRASDGIMQLEKIFPSSFRLEVTYAPKDAVVKIDDKPEGEDGRVSVTLSEGKHTIQVQKTGYAPFGQDLDVSSTTKLLINLQEIPSTTPTVPDTIGETYAWRGPVGWGALGLGALTAGMGVMSLMESGEASDLASQASEGGAHDAYKRAFERHQLIGSLSVTLGVAALGAGAYLLLSGQENPEESGATVLPTGHGVLVRW